ncbi:SRPBCC family protein [Gaoshiqia sediminis]|uniref:SRPBCC family protein n=1 Tax=Gaoshiqia sediminis TaxID=2986998 RepID=A0AA41Y5J2_9BACT|nr:SRPBCC family protein [Gaoshiqia sediminis]MCW0481273.1 SRPBCC family protein [Gaoshiqia sediminis]
MKIETNKNAPAWHREELLIDAPADRVYAILADIRNWAHWQSGVSKTKLHGKIVPGTSFDWKADGFSIKSDVHTAAAPLEFGWTGRMLWLKAVHNWTFYPEGNRTLVVVEESVEGFGAGLMQKALANGMKKSLLELKAEVERA